MSEEDNGASPEAAEQTDTRLSMEEQMGAIYDKMEAGEEAAPVEAAEAPAEQETGQEETQTGDERPRGPDGKFIAKDAGPEEAEATKAEENEQTVSAEEGHEAPTSWSAVAKAEWAKLPPAIQQEVLKREGDVAKGFEERATRLKSYEPIEQALEPVRQALDLRGVSPAQYIGQLVAAEQYLQKSPVEAIQYLAKSYGVDLQGLTQQQAESSQDPAMTAVQQQLREIEQRQTQHFQELANQQIQSAGKQIEAFKADPKHKHFDAVYDDMVALAGLEKQRGAQPTLESLYEKAIWANPTIRAQILAEQKAEQEARDKAEKAKRLTDAKRQEGVNLSTEGATGQTPAYGSIEEELAAAYDRIQGTA